MGFQGSKFEPGAVPESGTLAGAGSYVGINSDDEFILTSFFSGSGTSAAVTALNNKAQSRLVTIGSTTTELDGEANLTYDGSTFSIDDAAVFNDGGADNDFRVESVDETHMVFVDGGNNRVSVGDSVDAPAATLEVTNHASAGATGVPLIQLNSNDTDKIAIDINAANIDADVLDIAADAVTTANVLDITADGLTTGKILNLVSDSSNTDANTLALLHNDHASAVATTVLHVKNDAIAANRTVLVETTAAETNPLLELRNSNAATDKPVILSLNRTDSSAEADDMSLGTIRFDGVDSGNNGLAYVTIEGTASDITNNDEGGKLVINVMAGGTAGTAGVANLLSVGGEDQANSTPCEVTINDAGIDSDFRVESNDETHMIFVDAGNNRVSIGDSVDAPAATLEVTNHASAGATGVALVQLNSNDLDKVALDINAANTTANAVDITADVTTAAALAVTANALTTGAGLSVTSTSTDNSTGTSVLAQIVSDGNRGSDSVPHIGLFLDFDSTAGTAAKALYIDSEQTTGQVIAVDADQITTGVALEISTDARTTGAALNISDSATGDSAGSLVKIAQTGNRAGSAASIGLDIDFNTAANAAARAFKIDSEQTTGIVAEINGDALTTGTAIDISTDARTTGTALSISDSATNDNAGSLVKIAQTGNRAGSAASIGLDIDFNTAAAAAARALRIDSEQTTGVVAEIDGDALTTGTGLSISADALTTGTALKVADDSSDTGTRNTVEIIQDNVAAVGATALKIQSDSNGPVAALSIDRNAAGTAAADGITGIVVDLDQTGEITSATAVVVGIDTTVETNSASDGTINSFGHRIVVTGDTDGTHSNTGISINVGGADTNKHIELLSAADTADSCSIEVGGSGATTITTVDGGGTAADLTFDVDGDIILDADGGDVKFYDAGSSNSHLIISNSSNDAVIKPGKDAKDIILQQFDGTEALRIEDNISVQFGGTGGLNIAPNSNIPIIKPMTDAKDVIIQQFDGTEVARVHDGHAGGTVVTNLSGQESGFGYRRPVSLIIVDGGDVAVSLTTALSGYIVQVEPVTSHNCTITLPVAVLGTTYEIWLAETVPGGKTIKIQTPGTDNNDNFYGYFFVPGGSHTMTTDFAGDVLTVPAGAVRLTAMSSGGGDAEIWQAECFTSIVCTVGTS